MSGPSSAPPSTAALPPKNMGLEGRRWLKLSSQHGLGGEGESPEEWQGNGASILPGTCAASPCPLWCCWHGAAGWVSPLGQGSTVHRVLVSPEESMWPYLELVEMGMLGPHKVLHHAVPAWGRDGASHPHGTRKGSSWHGTAVEQWGEKTQARTKDPGT